MENAPASLSPHITISPGPTMASSVFSLADQPARGAESSAGMVPSAPRMSPACASSRAALRVMEAMVNTPFTSRDLTETGADAHARPERGRQNQRAGSLSEAACARDRMGQQRAGPTSARTIRVHRLPPFHRDARGRQATLPADLLPAGTIRVTPEETNAREKEIPGRTSLVRALALHGVLRPAVLSTVRLPATWPHPLGRGEVS